MTNKLRRRTQLTLVTEHGDLELEFEPYNEDDVLIERVGDKLVVAYLVHDDCPGINPLKDYDCQGDLYTKTPYSACDRTITDNDSEFYSALGLDGYGEIDLDQSVTIKGVTKDLCEHAADRLWDELDGEQLTDLLLHLEKWGGLNLSEGDHLEKLESGEPSRQLLTYLRGRYEKQIREDLADYRGYFSDQMAKHAEALYSEHWQQIAGPYVVPVASSGGNYETRYSTTTWDGDINDLPDGVWVADKGAIENIGKGCHKGVVVKRGKETYLGPNGWIVEADGRNVAFFPDNAGVVVDGQPEAYKQARDYVDQHYADRPMDVHTAAVHYAAGVLEEYSKWCSGDVYGCVTQVFTLAKEPDEGEEPEWIASGDYDSCWGFIGQEHAEESLKDEFFDPVVERLKKAQTQPASN